MATRKTYHLVPTLDILPPPNGPLTLGSILAAADEPSRPINDSEQSVEIPPELVTTFVETDWRKTISVGSKTKLGVYATFLQLNGLGPELSVSYEKSTEKAYAFESLTTVSFEPSDDFVAQLIKGSRSVQQYMEAKWYGRRDPVFVVTGYKKVKGARVKNSAASHWTTDANLGPDLTSTGVPVQVGPQVNIRRGRGEETESKFDDEILFAYRLRRVQWKRGTVKSGAYNRGAFLKIQDSDSEDEPSFELENMFVDDAGDGDSDSEDEPSFEVENVIDDDAGDEDRRRENVIEAVDEVDHELVNIVQATT